LYQQIVKHAASKLVSISPFPVRRLSESNAQGARLDHVRQCRFAFHQLPPGPVIFTVFPAVVAALLYAGLLQSVRKHAAPVFTGISAITFVVTLIPDFTYIPTVDGVSNAEIGVLVVMHAIAAAVITRGLTSVRR
jgi:hypothetical protein